MPATLEAESTLTDRYQTTVPETVRRALRLGKRDKIHYTIRPNGEVVLTRAAPGDSDDPALMPFLGFLARDMAELDAWLHYRLIDVSSLKELARRWYPAVYENRPPKNGGHRALADIIESLDELRYYRKAFMAPAPGPDDAASKAIAADIVATSILNK